MKTTLYIMTGLPFSGKSTLSRALAEHINAVLISFDKVWEEKQEELKKVADKNEEWRQVLNHTHKKIKKSLLEGKSVVYDDTNARKEHRDELRRIAGQALADVKIVFLDTPIEKIIKREKENKTLQNRHEVTSENFLNLKDQFQAPTKEEDAMRFTPLDNVKNWLEDNIK